MADSRQDTTLDVCVIGGGWSGIAAAIEACDAGRHVTLFEAAPQLGGRARTIAIDMGFGQIHLDNGQHLMMGAYRETLALISRIAPEASQHMHREPMALRDTDGLEFGAAGLPAPLHLAVGFAMARGLGLNGRLACLRLMYALWQRDWQVPDGETVSQLFARTRQPDWLIRRLWRPLCISALNTPPDDACARTFSAVLRDTLGAARAASDFILPDNTLGECLPHPASIWLKARGARIVLRTPVRSVQRDGSLWRIALMDGAPLARSVVLAAPPANSARLISAAPGAEATSASLALRDALSAFRPIPIATTYLAWPESEVSTLPRWTMLSALGLKEGEAAGDWLFDRGVHRGHRLAAIVVSNATTPGGSLEHLTVAVSKSATRALGLPAPSHSFTVFERRATFACVPDRPLIEQPAAGNLPGLWLAGDYTERDYPATIESAVRSGLRAGALAARQASTHRASAQLQASDSA